LVRKYFISSILIKIPEKCFKVNNRFNEKQCLHPERKEVGWFKGGPSSPSPFLSPLLTEIFIRVIDLVS
jgi:hypothetical protein